MSNKITKLTFSELVLLSTVTAVMFFISLMIEVALLAKIGFNDIIALIVSLPLSIYLAKKYMTSQEKSVIQDNNKKLADTLEIEAYEKDLYSQCKEMKLFNLQDISDSYKALGSVESSDENKELAQGKLCKQAKILGANAILNLILNIETKTEGRVSTSRDLISREAHVSGSTTSTSIFYYTGTAIFIEEFI